jgi:hypothetical protein
MHSDRNSEFRNAQKAGRKFVTLVVIAVFLSCCGNISEYGYVMYVKALCVCAPTLDGMGVLKVGRQ